MYPISPLSYEGWQHQELARLASAVRSRHRPHEGWRPVTGQLRQGRAEVGVGPTRDGNVRLIAPGFPPDSSASALRGLTTGSARGGPSRYSSVRIGPTRAANLTSSMATAMSIVVRIGPYEGWQRDQDAVDVATEDGPHRPYMGSKRQAAGQTVGQNPVRFGPARASNTRADNLMWRHIISTIWMSASTLQGMTTSRAQCRRAAASGPYRPYEGWQRGERPARSDNRESASVLGGLATGRSFRS